MTSTDGEVVHFPNLSTALFVYASLFAFRLANALLIQTQFDPDEYWQTLEPAYCEAFPDRPCAYTWEWTRRSSLDDAKTDEWWPLKSFYGPIRSYISVLPTYIFYSLVRRWKWDELRTWIVPKGPMLLHAVLVAAPTDLAAWYMGQWVGLTSSSRSIGDRTRTKLSYGSLLCSVTSWFNGYALIRTYSNSLEAMLLAVGVALVSPELFGDTLRRNRTLRTALAFLLGGISVAVRFTSLVAFIPLGILLALQSKTLAKCLIFLLFPCALFGLVGIGLSLIVDRYFYGFWTVPFLGSVHFNVILGLGSLYGSHPLHWYFSSGIPAITGTLLPFVLYDFWTLLRCPSSSLAQRNAWVIIASYALLHSTSAHKEFRFLLPILPLFCVRAGHVICNKMLTSPLRRLTLVGVLVLPNFMALLYLGSFHQGAPIRINQRIRQLVAHDGKKRHYTVHYLMGCHSTPLYSHLHVPSSRIDAWTLDCSPSCRASSDVDCESELFFNDPTRFVDNVYGRTDGEANRCTTTNNEDEYCLSEMKPVPDLVAVYSRESFILKGRFESMGLVEVDRFVHGINGLKVGPLQCGDDFSSSDSFRHLKLFGTMEISLEDMVLFANPAAFRALV